MAAGLVGSAFAQQPAPKLQLSQNSWDFGEVWHGEHPTLDLVLTNIGDADMVFRRIKACCGTIAKEPERMQLAPGESATVRLKFDTTNKQGKVQSKLVINYYDDPQVRDPKKEQTQRFKISGFVKRRIMRDPAGGLIIRGMDPKAGATGAVRLENQLPEPLKLKLLNQKMANVEVEVKEITPGRVYEVTGRTTKDHPPGTYRGTLEFATGWEQHPTIELPVWVTTLSPVRATPSAIYLDPSSADEATEKVVLLQCLTGLPFAVKEWHCSHEGVKVRLGQVESVASPREGMQFVVHIKAMITVPPVSSIPPEGVRIEFITNKEECPKVEVLITTDVAAYRAAAYGNAASTPSTKGNE